MIFVKDDSVKFKRFTNGSLIILNALMELSKSYAIVITSANDAKHLSNSKHYTDQAFDIRSKIFTKQKKAQFVKDLQVLLGPKFTVLLESIGTDNEHFHVQVRKGLNLL